MTSWRCAGDDPSVAADRAFATSCLVALARLLESETIRAAHRFVRDLPLELEYPFQVLRPHPTPNHGKERKQGSSALRRSHVAIHARAHRVLKDMK